NGSDARSYPYKRDQAANGNCREGPGSTPKIYKFSDFSQSSLNLNSPAILPVNFFLAAPSNRRTTPDLCCPGTSCNFRKNSTYSCACRPARTTISTGCSDPEGQCSNDIFINSFCDDLGIGCPEWRVGPCTNATPTPTPSPTPESCP